MDSHMAKKQTNDRCMMCDAPAEWIRSTQFAGDHPFCRQHAEAEEGFGENDSYEFWYEVEYNATT